MVQIVRCECGGEHHADHCPANWWSQEEQSIDGWKEIRQEDLKELKLSSDKAVKCLIPGGMSRSEMYRLIYSIISTELLFDQLHRDWSLSDYISYLSLQIARNEKKECMR